MYELNIQFERFSVTHYFPSLRALHRFHGTCAVKLQQCLNGIKLALKQKKTEYKHDFTGRFSSAYAASCAIELRLLGYNVEIKTSYGRISLIINGEKNGK